MADLSTQVQELYVAYFGRPADYSGLQYWIKLVDSASGYDQAVHAFALSSEYNAMYGGLSNADLVNAVYQHLFGRNAETAGLDFWVNALDNKVMTITDVVTTVADGAQGSDSFVFNSKVTAADLFTRHLDTAVEILAYSGTTANKMAFDYLAAIKDEDSASFALDTTNIDALIAKMSNVTFLPGGTDAAQLVGVHDVAAHA